MATTLNLKKELLVDGTNYSKEEYIANKVETLNLSEEDRKKLVAYLKDSIPAFKFIYNFSDNLDIDFQTELEEGDHGYYPILDSINIGGIQVGSYEADIGGSNLTIIEYIVSGSSQATFHDYLLKV